MDLNTAATLFSGIPIFNLVLGLSFATIVLFVGGFGYWFVDETPLVKRRLRAIQEGQEALKKIDHMEGAFLVRWAEPVSKLILPDNNWKKSRIRKRLVLAGYRSHRALYIYGFAKFCLAIAVPLFLAIVCIAANFNPLRDTGGIMLLLFSALSGLYMPDLFLVMQANDRQVVLREDFPDAMDLMVVCIEAGLGLDAAIKRVGKELEASHPELGLELSLVSLEMKAGKTKEEALRSLAERTGLPEIKALTSILIQAEHFGTSISASLIGHSDEMRNVRTQTARERAAKLPVKMAFPVMFCIFPALFLVLLGPAFIKMLSGFSILSGG